MAAFVFLSRGTVDTAIRSFTTRHPREHNSAYKITDKASHFLVQKGVTTEKSHFLLQKGVTTEMSHFLLQKGVTTEMSHFLLQKGVTTEMSHFLLQKGVTTEMNERCQTFSDRKMLQLHEFLL